MRLILLLFIINISSQALCQKLLFDTLLVDSTTKIIGRYPHNYDDKTFGMFNFILEDSIEIVKFIKNTKLGKEVENSSEVPNFRLTVVKNYREIGMWTINPTLKSAMTHDGSTYKFDFKQIKYLNSHFPFDYYLEKIVFDSKLMYNIYFQEQKNNPNFLFVYWPTFKYEGSFESEFIKSTKFPNPKAISEFLDPHIKKIVNTEDYRIEYIVNERNTNNVNQFTMTISGSKKLFNELKIPGLNNDNWQPTQETGYFFYKK